MSESPGEWVTITPSGGVRQPIWRRLRSEAPLLWVWTDRELRSRYRQSWLRVGWAPVQPTIILLTYGLVFGVILDVPSDGLPYLTFAWAGLVPISFVQQALAEGVGSIQHAGPIITKVYFPREVLPLSIIGANVFDLIITTVTLVILSWFQVGSVPVTIVALPLVWAALIAWTAGLTIIAAGLTAYRRDLNHAMPIILRVLLIITPVMYPVSLLQEVVGPLVWLNPYAVIVEATRDCVSLGRWPSMALVATLLIGCFVLLGSIAAMQRWELRLADHV